MHFQPTGPVRHDLRNSLDVAVVPGRHTLFVDSLSHGDLDPGLARATVVWRCAGGWHPNG